MPILTTTRDQVRVGAAARRVGGYDELIRLDRERTAAGPGAVLKRINGRLCYVAAEPPPAPSEETTAKPSFWLRALRWFR